MQAVVAFAALQPIRSVAPKEQVIATSATQAVVAFTTDKGLVAERPEKAVGFLSTDHFFDA